jgi:hypothetical protein
MVSAHKDSVQTRHDGDRMFFDVNCPLCPEGMTREVNPRGRDQEFLEKFADEIRMVGYDLLLYHWETHEESGAAVENEADVGVPAKSRGLDADFAGESR